MLFKLILLICATTVTFVSSVNNNFKKLDDESNSSAHQLPKKKFSKSDLKIAYNTDQWVTFEDDGPSIILHTSPTPTSMDGRDARRMKKIASERLNSVECEKIDDNVKIPAKVKGSAIIDENKLSLSEPKKIDDRTYSIASFSGGNSNKTLVVRKCESPESITKATGTNLKDKGEDAGFHWPSSDLRRTSHKNTSTDLPRRNSTSGGEIVSISSFSSHMPSGYEPLLSLKDNPLLNYFHSDPYKGPKRIENFGWKWIAQSTRQQVELDYLLGKGKVTDQMSGHTVDLEARKYSLHKMNFSHSKHDENKRDFFHIKECVRDSSVEALQLMYPQYRLEEYDKIKPVEIKYRVVENSVILPHIFLERGREQDDDYRQEVRAIQTMIRCNYANVKVFDIIEKKIARINLSLYVADNDRGDVFYFRPFRTNKTKFLPTYCGKRRSKFRPSDLWKKLPYLSDHYYEKKMGKMRRVNTLNTRLDSLKNDTELKFFEPRASA